jgi:hypothetical protein
MTARAWRSVARLLGELLIILIDAAGLATGLLEPVELAGTRNRLYDVFIRLG